MNISMHDGKIVEGAANGGSGGGKTRSVWKRPAWITGLMLLIPLWGNHYVKGWNWPFMAFVLAGTLIFSTALTYELVSQQANSRAYRVAVALSLLTGFAVMWLTISVKIIGDENPANLLFLVVLMLGMAGAVIGRFRPLGMARALLAMAVAQALVPVIGVMMWGPPKWDWRPGVGRVFALNAAFVLLFACAAWLFRRAERKDS